MKNLALAVLRLYKRWISPALPPSCRYVPTCSEYAMEAVERYGIVRGGLMSVWRLLRCHPFVKGGLDPVVKPTCRIKHDECGDMTQAFDTWAVGDMRTANSERRTASY